MDGTGRCRCVSTRARWMGRGDETLAEQPAGVETAVDEGLPATELLTRRWRTRRRRPASSCPPGSSTSPSSAGASWPSPGSGRGHLVRRHADVDGHGIDRGRRRRVRGLRPPRAAPRARGPLPDGSSGHRLGYRHPDHRRHPPRARARASCPIWPTWSAPLQSGLDALAEPPGRPVASRPGSTAWRSDARRCRPETPLRPPAAASRQPRRRRSPSSSWPRSSCSSSCGR